MFHWLGRTTLFVSARLLAASVYMTLPKSKSKKGTSIFFIHAEKKQPDVPVFLVTSGCLIWYK